MGGEVLKNRFKLIGDGEKILPLKMLNKNKVFNELFSKVEKILKKYHIILFRGDFKIPFEYLNFNKSGPDRDRTDYLFHAMEALHQLSYRPISMGIFNTFLN